jgi:hypothetical protein
MRRKLMSQTDCFGLNQISSTGENSLDQYKDKGFWVVFTLPLNNSVIILRSFESYLSP